MLEQDNSLFAPSLRGVFSTTVMGSVGFGHTRKRVPQKILVYIEELDNGKLQIQQINTNFVPTGKTKYIAKDKFFENYLPEPEIYTNKVFPVMRKLSQTISQGERHYRKGELFSSEYQFKNALRIDEENIRATFGLGLTFLQRGDRDKGDLVFRRLIRMDAAFEPAHKHLFNDFGIKLRKCAMYSQAIRYYSKAMRLSNQDEHLLFNMARALYEKGNLPAAKRFVVKSLELNDDFDESRSFLKILNHKLAKNRNI